ncbi:MAG: TIGR03936 family radical SAM-associated protein [Anaerolineae bacterium]|nr:MAG: TIGR03936 family radical SAM-associated protein [Anaerolineae bacterium]
MQANYKQRLRMRFSKDGPARFISHLDLSRTLERALNRAQIPIAYTQGFNPQPRMQFADALPLGLTSDCEIVDFWLKVKIETEETLSALKAKMASGIGVISIEEVAVSAPPLQTITKFAEYRVTLSDEFTAEMIEAKVDALLETPTIPRLRRNKQYDLRPLVLGLNVISHKSDSVELAMKMSLEPGRTGRPDEVLKALNIDPLGARIHRTNLILAETENDDEPS